MRKLKLLITFVYCSKMVFCAPTEETEPTSTTEPTVAEDHESSAEVATPPKNVNIADYYYSIFGKHLDYDYREPLLTFEDSPKNDLSDEILSEVDKGTDPWEVHSRKKRFIVVSENFLNSTVAWAQRMRRVQMERRRARQLRRQQWRQNRIRYFNARSAALAQQAQRLMQLQQRQLVTRSVPQNAGVAQLYIPTNTESRKPTTVAESNTAPNLNGVIL